MSAVEFCIHDIRPREACGECRPPSGVDLGDDEPYDDLTVTKGMAARLDALDRAARLEFEAAEAEANDRQAEQVDWHDRFGVAQSHAQAAMRGPWRSRDRREQQP